MIRAAGLAAALLAVAPGIAPAWGHAIEAEPRGDGRFIVLFRDSAGAPLAGVAARVFAPGDSAVPDWTGTADADGRLAFTADRDGTWRVELTAADGHVDQALVRVRDGLPQSGNPAALRWLLAASLTGNILTAVLLSGPAMRSLRQRRTAERTRRTPT